MSKFERPEWYAKASAKPFRKSMFTQNHKQQILNGINQKKKKAHRWPGYIGKAAAVTSIIMVALAFFVWGNLDENVWFSKKTGVNPSENNEVVSSSDLSSWNIQRTNAFLREVDQFVREIPIETTSKEQIIEQYEQYFSPELSEHIFHALYFEIEGKWMIPEGGGEYFFRAPNPEQNEVSIYSNGTSIIVEEKYEYWMYTKIQYTITYENNKPLITQWIRFVDGDPSTLFDAATVQKEDNIGDMKVIEYDLQEIENIYFGTVQFQGTVMLTGTLTYSNDDDMGESFIFTVDSASMPKLPRMMHDTRHDTQGVTLNFDNIEEAKALLGIQSDTDSRSETVVVEIDHYLINYQEKVVHNTAKLNDVYYQLTD